MDKIILQCNNLRKIYKKKDHLHVACDDINLYIKQGECLGIVGESGSGKSTLANIIMNLEKADSGTVLLNNKDITNIKSNKLKEIYKDIQMVFQDAIGSFNPRFTIEESIMEYVCNLCSTTEADKKHKVDNLLQMVGLSKEYKYRYPHELSGGQCQRAAIARALSAHPKILVCDEATSALDVSVQAQIVELLKEMQEKMNISYLFITHDLALVSSFCDRVAVMKNGKIYTTEVTPIAINPNPLSKIIEYNGVDSKYNLGDNIDKWKYLKGAKDILRKAGTPYEYHFREGAIAFPDSLDKPARTMLTSEGSLNRSTHVIEDPKSKCFRILTPLETERINGFPDNWTDTGMPQSFRYFCMGNALVVGLIEKMGERLNEIFDKE